jgi:hypothetical protein
MLFIRPFFVSIIHRKFISSSIYTALHFYPCLLILHALCSGLICKKINKFEIPEKQKNFFFYFV